MSRKRESKKERERENGETKKKHFFLLLFSFSHDFPSFLPSILLCAVASSEDEKKNPLRNSVHAIEIFPRLFRKMFFFLFACLQNFRLGGHCFAYFLNFFLRREGNRKEMDVRADIFFPAHVNRDILLAKGNGWKESGFHCPKIRFRKFHPPSPCQMESNRRPSISTTVRERAYSGRVWVRAPINSYPSPPPFSSS